MVGRDPRGNAIGIAIVRGDRVLVFTDRLPGTPRMNELRIRKVGRGRVSIARLFFQVQVFNAPDSFRVCDRVAVMEDRITFAIYFQVGHKAKQQKNTGNQAGVVLNGFSTTPLLTSHLKTVRTTV